MKTTWLLSTTCALAFMSTCAAMAQSASSQSTATGNPELKPGQTEMAPAPVGTAATPAPMPGAAAAVPATGAVSMQDAKFVKQASASSDAEIMLGGLAQKRSQSDAVRSYGAMIVSDHTKANATLMPIAQSIGAAPAAGPNAMQQSAYAKLEAAPATRFDAGFAHVAVMSHQMAIVAFQREIRLGNDQALKAFASQQLPTLQQHLIAAEDLPGAHMRMSNSMVHHRTGGADSSADDLNAKELTAGHS
jgi:putative membrane protein